MPLDAEFASEFGIKRKRSAADIRAEAAHVSRRARGSAAPVDDQVHWDDNTLVLMAVDESGTLVMNHYIVCRSSGRARMMYSASQFRGINSSADRNRIARANRFLHFEAMRYFKRMGLKTYDFGEFAVDTDDESLQGGNRFNESFGGGNEACYKSQTLPMFLLSETIRLARTMAQHRRIGDRLRGTLRYARGDTKSLS
jgi:hypothetical protein